MPVVGAELATGLFGLGGVILGAATSMGTQIYLERRREAREIARAKQVVAGELLQAQLVLRAFSKGTNWPPWEDVDVLLPTSAWRDNRSRLATTVDEELWSELVTAYVILETDRARFAMAAKLSPATPLPAAQVVELTEAADILGSLRGRLGLGGGWLDEVS